MWSVCLVDNAGAILEVLSSGERELRGAVAFAAGLEANAKGSAVVMPSDAVAMFDREIESNLPTGAIVDELGSWDLFVCDADGESQVSTEPYDAEQVVAALVAIELGAVDCEAVCIVPSIRSSRAQSDSLQPSLWNGLRAGRKLQRSAG